MQKVIFDETSYGAFLNACKVGDLDVVKDLLEKYSFDPSTSANFNKGLNEACTNMKWNIVNFLLTIDYVKESNNKETFLSAILAGELETIRLFPKSSLYLNILKEKNKIFLWAFISSILKNKLEVVEFLLNNTSVDATHNKNFPLRLACSYGHWEIVKFLLDNKFVNNLAEQLTNDDAINYAIKFQNYDIINLFFEKNCKISENLIITVNNEEYFTVEIKNIVNKYKEKQIKYNKKDT